MEAGLEELLTFLAEQKTKHAPRFPALKCEKVLSFMGTSSLAGMHATVAVCPLLGLAPVNGGKELHVRLRGPLPRTPTDRECLTVHVTNLAQYQGYQVKTRALGPQEPAGAIVEDAEDGVVLVKGAQTFTVHHSPYTMKFFEQIPFDEVQQTVGGLRFALVGIGERANISPRFVFHSESRLGRVSLFHGDGLALKTYANLRSNRQETRLVLDLDDFSGFLLRGTVEEFQPQQHPEAYERVCEGFLAGNWGKPSRTFRFVADHWERIAPTAAPAPRRAGG